MVGHGQRGAPGGLGVLLGMGVPLVAGGGQGYGVLLGYGGSPKVWAALRDMGGSWGMGGVPKSVGYPQGWRGTPGSSGCAPEYGGLHKNWGLRGYGGAYRGKGCPANWVIPGLWGPKSVGCPQGMGTPLGGSEGALELGDAQNFGGVHGSILGSVVMPQAYDSAPQLYGCPQGREVPQKCGVPLRLTSTPNP